MERRGQQSVVARRLLFFRPEWSSLAQLMDHIALSTQPGHAVLQHTREFKLMEGDLVAQVSKRPELELKMISIGLGAIYS